jgi:uncharacterized integral membrane protein
MAAFTRARAEYVLIKDMLLLLLLLLVQVAR